MQTTHASSFALGSPEILAEIFSFLAPGPPDEEALYAVKRARKELQATLARAARVCRAFSVPALSALWRVTDSIVLLLSVLPSVILKARLPPRDVGFYYGMTRDATDAEWIRFQEYAMRVRHLHARREDPPISPTAWTFLARRCGGNRALLPLLRTLEVKFVAPDAGPILLLSTNLRHLSIDFRAEPTTSSAAEAGAVNNVIIELLMQDIIPSLLALRVRSDNVAVTGKIPYSTFAHLHVLEVAQPLVVDRDMLGALMAFPHLLRLVMLVERLSLPEGVRLSPGFATLRELELIGHPQELQRFIHATTPPSIQSLALTIRSWTIDPIDETSGDILAIETLLRSVTRAVRRLKLSFATWIPPQGIDGFLLAAIELNDLTHLAINVEEPSFPSCVLFEDTFRDVVAAWPNLVELTIDILRLSPDPDVISTDTFPTLQALILFLQHHPGLETLVLPFLDGVTSDLRRPFPEVDAVPLLGHGLKTLRISLVDDVGLPKLTAVAMAVDRLAPNLDLSAAQHQVWIHRCPREYSHWADVEQVLFLLRTTRGERRTIWKPFSLNLSRVGL
ncbi:hypothetical protein GY45DRAFT_1323794 [Cubamyces sp. BRFM 1775]|nr:hypothetical protein GY45DRAFT_1323794 [Cubamyces sp. BRFM 1775]